MVQDKMTTLTFANLPVQFIEEVPEYKDVYDHEMAYYGDISLWTFFGSKLVKFALKKLEKFLNDPQDTVSKDVVLRILDFVERCVTSNDEEITELIYTSFLEAVYLARDNYDKFVALFGTASKKALIEVEKGWNK